MTGLTEKIIAATREALELMQDPSVPKAYFLPADQASDAISMANELFGDHAIRTLGENVGVVVDEHGHFVALMDQETYDALTKIPAGALRPRVYESSATSHTPTSQMPYWANDWRRGRKGRRS